MLAALNKSLHINDGQGEEFLGKANAEITETRFQLGQCAVKPLIPEIQDIVDIQNIRYRQQ